MAKKVSKSYHKNVNAKDIRIWRKWQKRTKVFALVGLVLVAGVGGYFAYKSFATEASFAYTVGNGYLQKGTDSAVVPGSSSKGKAGASVLVMQPGGYATVANPTPGKAGTGEILIPAGQRFAVCVDVKGTDGIPYVKFASDQQAMYIDKFYGVTPLADGYNELCNTNGGTDGRSHSGPVTLRNATDSYFPFDAKYISAFVIKFINY